MLVATTYLFESDAFGAREDLGITVPLFLFTSRLRVKKKKKIAALAGCIVNILVNSTKLFHNLITERKVLMTSLYIA